MGLLVMIKRRINTRPRSSECCLRGSLIEPRFEETLCELCSIYCIHHFVIWCENNPLPRQYAPSVREYLDQLTSGQLCADHLRDYISQNLDLLSSPDYQRGIYKRIAATILPSFVACPDLWRIIPLIGDSRQWLK